MGKRGPAKKPSALERLQGNPGRRSLNQDEPKAPAVGELSPPSHLDVYAREEWERVAPLLDTMGVLRKPDIQVLAGYCQQYSIWRTASEFVAKHGTTYVKRDADGKPKSMSIVPQYRIMQEALMNVLRLGAQFGLTPSSRSSIKADAPKQESRWREFLDTPIGPSVTRKPS